MNYLNEWLLIVEVVLLIGVFCAILYFIGITLEKYIYRNKIKKRKSTPYATRRQKLKEYNRRNR